MNSLISRTWKRTIVVLGALTLALTLMVGPALATEGGGTEGERDKITLPETSHDRVGLILIGLTIVGSLLALDNARRQLRGERKQASGEWRWR